MITIKEYYSDVQDEKDKNLLSRCKCNKVFPTIEILLNIPEEEEYNESDITEHCPFCKKELA